MWLTLRHCTALRPEVNIQCNYREIKECHLFMWTTMVKTRLSKYLDAVVKNSQAKQCHI